MATRRMFSLRVINSARFLKMPISSQALYFHLGMAADDDGVVEAYGVVKMVGCSEDDLRVLVSKGFIKILNEDLVSYITDWTENNKIRADRKIDSIYKDLLIHVDPDVKLIERRPRTDVQAKGNQVATNGQPMDVQWTTNGQPMDSIGKDRIGEDRIGEDNIDALPRTVTKRFIVPTVEEIRTYCKEKGLTNVDPEAFFDFYESKNWYVGKNKMKDWKAAARNWNRTEKDRRHGTKNKLHFDGEQKYNTNDLESRILKRVNGG